MSAPSSPDLEAVLAARRAMLDHFPQPGYQLVSVDLVIRGPDGLTRRLGFATADYLPVAGPLPAETIGGIGGFVPNDLDRTILQTLREAGQPIKPSTVARRAGKAYNGWFRERVKRLKSAGLIVEIDDKIGLSNPTDNRQETAV